MKPKTFYIVLFSVLGLCVALTAAHFLYAADAYSRCSIIYFVGKEIW